jgi:L-alanine-DL-glutamate epimerase-like enolase superfamily enzyme
MKHRNRAVLLLVLFLAASCASTTPATVAYRTIAIVKLTVDTGMSVWGDRVAAGLATAAQETQVKAAFNKYTKAAAAAAAGMRAESDPAPPNLTAAADALLSLLASFGVNVGGK